MDTSLFVFDCWFEGLNGSGALGTGSTGTDTEGLVLDFTDSGRLGPRGSSLRCIGSFGNGSGSRRLGSNGTKIVCGYDLR